MESKHKDCCRSTREAYGYDLEFEEDCAWWQYCAVCFIVGLLIGLMLGAAFWF